MTRGKTGASSAMTNFSNVNDRRGARVTSARLLISPRVAINAPHLELRYVARRHLAINAERE